MLKIFSHKITLKLLLIKLQIFWMNSYNEEKHQQK